MNPHVHQIVFQDAEAPPPQGYVAGAMESVRDTFSGCRYRCWSLPDATDFLATHYPAEVSETFHRLAPYSFKADLFKYCLLHTLGGWYVDAGVRMLASPAAVFTGEEPAPRLVVFRSTGPWDATWNCSLALVYAQAGEAVFEQAISDVIRNCADRYYGETPLCPTMSCFGRSMAVLRVVAGVKIGEVVDVEGEAYRRAFHLDPLGLVAARKPKRFRVGSVKAGGIKGSNNYVELWRARRIYGES